MFFPFAPTATNRHNLTMCLRQINQEHYPSSFSSHSEDPAPVREGTAAEGSNPPLDFDPAWLSASLTFIGRLDHANIHTSIFSVERIKG